jgi:hypothetical protein
VRETAAALLRYAKTVGTPIILIGHITKDGSIAGPKVLEHIVDVVLQFEGDQNYLYRILRSGKNRFGSTSEIGIFEMQNSGLLRLPTLRKYYYRIAMRCLAVFVLLPPLTVRGHSLLRHNHWLVPLFTEHHSEPQRGLMLVG